MVIRFWPPPPRAPPPTLSLLAYQRTQYAGWGTRVQGRLAFVDYPFSEKAPMHWEVFLLVLIISSMSNATGALKWAVREGTGVSIRVGSPTFLEFAGQAPSTAVSAVPYRRDVTTSVSFTVRMTKKVGRTAVGFQLASPTCFEYLTPANSPPTPYISFGGAGFIYPTKASARGGYTEGDLVTATLSWSLNTVRYTVNTRLVGEVSFPGTVDVCFPSLSVEAGPVTAEVTIESEHS